MDWQSLKDPDIKRFIREHETADVAALALKKPPSPNWPYKDVLDQIKARQKAKAKMPTWYAANDMIFPPPGLIEQASSEPCARFKASLATGEHFIDLSAGTGMDDWALAGAFKTGTLIERDETAAVLLAHNLEALGLPHLKVINAKAEDAMADLPPADLIYIDPQRRDDTRKGKFRLEEASPDILSLLPAIKAKAKQLLIKTSPMLDIAQSCAVLGGVREVHILEWKGECKEVLYLLDFQNRPFEDVHIHAHMLNETGQPAQTLSFTPAQEQAAQCEYALPLRYLYEPGPALQKSGGFKTIAQRFALKKLAPHTHLYTSENLAPDFPGRTFAVQGRFKAQEKKIPLEKANITVRNFPETAENLRKKLKLKDGGADTLFACTLNDETKALIWVKAS